MSLRVLHHLRAGGDLDEMVALSRSLREEPGCREAEIYRSADTDRIALVELWDDAATYSRVWIAGLADRGSGVRDTLRLLEGADGSRVASEFYGHETFHRPDDTWWPTRSAAPSSHAIEWPAGDGPVRVLIQGTTDGSTPAGPSEGVVETRREPGCLQFESYQSIEFPQDSLLLELWQDQHQYDLHWRLRVRTRADAAARATGRDEPGPAAPPAKIERGQGSNGMEFYRHATYTHLYDRWVPADPRRRSETIRWPQ